MSKFRMTIGADFRSYLTFDIEAETYEEANIKGSGVVARFQSGEEIWPAEFGENVFSETVWDDPMNVEVVDLVDEETGA